MKISDDLYSINASVSTLEYATLSDHHFGHLYCWARNTMGVMSEPCIFNIIPARPPAPPTNCGILNQTTDVLQVECEPGFDGGLDQYFLLDVVDALTMMMLANVSSSRPAFAITGLNPGPLSCDIICEIENQNVPLSLPISAHIKGPDVEICNTVVNYGLVKLSSTVTEEIVIRNICLSFQG